MKDRIRTLLQSISGKNRITERDIENLRHYLTIKDRAPATVEKYIRAAKDLGTYLSGDSLTQESIVRYKHYLMDAGYSASGINSMRQ